MYFSATVKGFADLDPARMYKISRIHVEAIRQRIDSVHCSYTSVQAALTTASDMPFFNEHFLNSCCTLKEKCLNHISFSSQLPEITGLDLCTS